MCDVFVVCVYGVYVWCVFCVMCVHNMCICVCDVIQVRRHCTAHEFTLTWCSSTCGLCTRVRVV